MKSDKAVIIGGDSRSVYMEEYLISNGIRTVVFENDKESAIKELKKENVNVILPLPASRDKKNINTKDIKDNVSFDFLISLLKKGDRVFAGMINDITAEKFFDKGVEVIDYYDEELKKKNAKLTVMGLEKVFKENNIDLNEHKTVVTGFGKTAVECAEYLKSKNYDFVIAARSETAISLAKSMNINAVKLSDFTDEWRKFTHIINTVPAVIIDEKILSILQRGTVITDIASYPFGVDKDLAEKHNIKVIRALSLPGKYVPALAGIAIGERIKCLL